ncbi:FAD-binding oxidoreductase [Actinocorallia sp. A-T 12471]|uniref:FAD-binding oxidoreductase n=1 Tax=Actinocorallia sp. A-T 12471 TaxID=3089813 RepID=UPI0029CDB09B|nr:FAD-binding protein [Actinocorallia sp. A-T 12471]MDX6740124.1 FAD-binding protein [Actinocorallia sp. A-T 12471]
MTLSPRLLRALEDLLGPGRVVSGPDDVARYLRASAVGVTEAAFTAVARPRSVDDLAGIAAVAARHRVPLALRGAGTGPRRPARRGRAPVGRVAVDVRGVSGVIEVGRGRIAVLPGTVLRAADEAARGTGQELAVLPATRDVATASGFVSGGAGGLGSASHGELADGNVLAVELLTVEEEPRLIRLEGEEVAAVLGARGASGILTRIELRLVPARGYTAFCGVFTTFDACCRFGWDVVESGLGARMVSLHGDPSDSLPTSASDLCPDGPVALVWIDSSAVDELLALAARHGGLLMSWPDDDTRLPYSHHHLWPSGSRKPPSWVRAEYAAGERERFLAQVRASSGRPSGVYLSHLELQRTRQGGVRCLGFPPVTEPGPRPLDELRTVCASYGMTLITGDPADTPASTSLRRATDPHNLLSAPPTR